MGIKLQAKRLNAGYIDQRGAERAVEFARLGQVAVIGPAAGSATAKAPLSFK